MSGVFNIVNYFSSGTDILPMVTLAPVALPMVPLAANTTVQGFKVASGTEYIYIEKVLKILNTGCKYYESITMDAQI